MKKSLALLAVLTLMSLASDLAAQIRDLGAKSLALSDGFGATLTVSAPSPLTGSGTITLPDPTAGSFVMTNGIQVISGAKTFSGGAVIKTLSTSASPLSVDAPNGQTAHLQTWNVNANPLAIMTADGNMLAAGFISNVNLGSATSPAIGAYYADNAIIAWGEIDGAGATISEFGDFSSSLFGVGIYIITLPVGSLANGGAISITTTTPGTFASAVRVANVYTISISDAAGAAVPAGFSFIVTGRD